MLLFCRLVVIGKGRLGCSSAIVPRATFALYSTGLGLAVSAKEVD